MADPDSSENTPLLRESSQLAAPPAYSAYGNDVGIGKGSSCKSSTTFIEICVPFVTLLEV